MPESTAICPKLSIIIPCFNERKFIAACLSSITEHLRDFDYEIVIVDNGSTDDSAVVARQFPRVSVHIIPRSTISFARNYGVRQSRGELLAFVDSDILVTRAWTNKLLALMHAGVDCESYLGGYAYSIRESPSLIERAWFATILMVSPRYLSGGNIVVGRSAFDRLQGFDDFLQTGEDVEFCTRALRAGLQIDFDPAFDVVHLGYPSTIAHFVQRESWHGVGDFQSVSLFIRSKVAVMAVLFCFLAVVALAAFLVGSIWGALIALALHLCMPLLFTLYKFRLSNRIYFLPQYFLAYLYLGARAHSLARKLKGRTRA